MENGFRLLKLIKTKGICQLLLAGHVLLLGLPNFDPCCCLNLCDSLDKLKQAAQGDTSTELPASRESKAEPKRPDRNAVERFIAAQEILRATQPGKCWPKGGFFTSWAVLAGQWTRDSADDELMKQFHNSVKEVVDPRGSKPELVAKVEECQNEIMKQIHDVLATEDGSKALEFVAKSAKELGIVGGIAAVEKWLWAKVDLAARDKKAKDNLAELANKNLTAFLKALKSKNHAGYANLAQQVKDLHQAEDTADTYYYEEPPEAGGGLPTLNLLCAFAHSQRYFRNFSSHHKIKAGSSVGKPIQRKHVRFCLDTVTQFIRCVVHLADPMPQLLGCGGPDSSPGVLVEQMLQLDSWARRCAGLWLKQCLEDCSHPDPDDALHCTRDKIDARLREDSCRYFKLNVMDMDPCSSMPSADDPGVWLEAVQTRLCRKHKKEFRGLAHGFEDPGLALLLVEELRGLLRGAAMPVHPMRQTELQCRLANFFCEEGYKRESSPEVAGWLRQEANEALELSKGPFVDEEPLRRVVVKHKDSLGVMPDPYADKVRYLLSDDEEEKKRLWALWKDAEQKAWEEVSPLS